ncbi:MAG TPA: cyclase family protein, partial [Pseudonocardiaceae bacterium]
VRAAVTEVREGLVLGLAQPLGPATRTAPHRARPMRLMNRDGGDYAAGARRPDGFQFAEDTLVMPAHSGTHLDALAHVWYDDQLYNGHPGSGVRSTTGASRCGIGTVPPIVARGVLLDAVAHHGRPLDAGEVLDTAFVEAAYPDPRPGDVVLVRTGWIERAHADDAAYFAAEPGPDAAAGVWLAARGVALLGADNYAVEAQPSPDGDRGFPLHRRLLRDHGVPLLEGLLLAELAAALATLGRRTFLFVTAALPVVGGTAGPTHPVAVL